MRIINTWEADKEFIKLPLPVQMKFVKYFGAYIRGERLTGKIYKKLKGYVLFEFRVKEQSGIYRAIAGLIKPDLIIFLYFKKKRQKRPLEHLIQR